MEFWPFDPYKNWGGDFPDLGLHLNIHGGEQVDYLVVTSNCILSNVDILGSLKIRASNILDLISSNNIWKSSNSYVYLLNSNLGIGLSNHQFPLTVAGTIQSSNVIATQGGFTNLFAANAQINNRQIINDVVKNFTSANIRWNNLTGINGVKNTADCSGLSGWRNRSSLQLMTSKICTPIIYSCNCTIKSN
jgi:hypothetical protein